MVYLGRNGEGGLISLVQMCIELKKSKAWVTEAYSSGSCDVIMDFMAVHSLLQRGQR